MRNIIAIEGPNRAGKSTMIRELLQQLPKEARVVPRLFDVRDVKCVIEHVEEALLNLWEALYDPEQLYVTDRSFTLSPEVYAEVAQRPLKIDPSLWRERQHVFCLLPPVEVLCQRAALDNRPGLYDVDAYVKVLEMYRRKLHMYHWTPLPWELSPPEMASFIIERIEPGFAT